MIVPHSYLGRSRWIEPYIAAGARWIKITDAPDVAYALAARHPNVNVVYRRIDTRQLGDWMRDFPDAATAGATMAQLFGDIAPLPNLWVEGVNEPVLNSVAEAEYLGVAEAYRVKALAARGLKSVIGNFATGNPQNLMFVIWLRAFFGHGGTRASPIGLHEYGVIDIDPATDGFNMMGHRRLIREAGGLASACQWIVTETGLDEIHVNGVKRGGGWQSAAAGNPSQERYRDWLLKANAEWERDGVLAACLFTFNDTGKWSDYDMENADVVHAGVLAAMPARTYTRGIDVSHYQESATSWIDAYASGVRFAFINACDGTVKDALFDTHWAKSKGVVRRGGYHYLLSYIDGAVQGAFFVSLFKDGFGELRPCVDVEEASAPAYLHAQRLKQWIDVVEAASKKKPVIYTRPDIWARIAQYCAWAKDYDVWIARYPFTKKDPGIVEVETGKYDPADLAPFGRWSFWQYTDSGVVPGIGAPVDLDVFDGDEAALAAWGGSTIPEAVYTWQDFINASNRARRALGYADAVWWSWLFDRAGIANAAIAGRTKAYDGPKIDELNWSAREIAAYRAAGGKG